MSDTTEQSDLKRRANALGLSPHRLLEIEEGAEKGDMAAAALMVKIKSGTWDPMVDAKRLTWKREEERARSLKVTPSRLMAIEAGAREGRAVDVFLKAQIDAGTWNPEVHAHMTQLPSPKRDGPARATPVSEAAESKAEVVTRKEEEPKGSKPVEIRRMVAAFDRLDDEVDRLVKKRKALVRDRNKMSKEITKLENQVELMKATAPQGAKRMKIINFLADAVYGEDPIKPKKKKPKKKSKAKAKRADRSTAVRTRRRPQRRTLGTSARKR